MKEIILDPLMANSKSTIDLSNEITHELRLDDYNIQIKLEILKQIMHSVSR